MRNPANILKNGLLPLLVFFLAILSIDCWASPIPQLLPIEEQQLKSMSLEQLGNIRVTTVSKQPEKLWQTPAAVFVITAEDIRRSGATTIPELLRLVPGVQVSRMQSDEWAVGIRGFASGFSKGLLLLIDGRSAYTPLFEGVYWDMQDLVLSNIERIEVIRGPAGTVWGTNAVNGVINIITKKAFDTQGYYANIQGGGPLEHFIGELRGGWSPRPNLQVRLFAKGFNRGPELNPGNDPYDHWHQARGGFRADWQPNGRDTMMMEGQIYKGVTGVQDPTAQFFPPGNLVVNSAQRVSGGDIILRWNRTLNARSNFYVQAYFDRTNRADVLGEETRNTFDVDFVDHIGFLPRQDIVWGAGLRESPSKFAQVGITLNFTPHQLTDYVYSGFFQDKFQIVPDRLAVILGSKIQNNNYSGTGIEPSSRLLWTPTTHQTVWGGVSRALRTPGRLDRDVSEFENAVSAPPVFVQVVGNPNFKPEVLISWEAGYRRLLTQNLYVDLALFHNQYDDLESYGNPEIVASFPTQPYPYTLLTAMFHNGEKGVTDGLELAPDWKPFDWLDLRGTYSHLHMDLHPKAGFTEASIIHPTYTGSSPDHMATAQALATLPHGIQIDPDYRYMSALPAQNVPSYQTADVHLAWKCTTHIELSADGRNLLQPSHREFIGYNNNPVGIRRGIYAGIAWIP